MTRFIQFSLIASVFILFQTTLFAQTTSEQHFVELLRIGHVDIRYSEWHPDGEPVMLKITREKLF